MNFKEIILQLKKLDWFIIISAFFLVGFGLVSLRSSSLASGDFLNFNKQIIFFAIGVSLMFILSFFDYRVIRDAPYLILFFYFLCLAALLGLFFLAPETRGIRGWYRIGPVSIDPIEPTKIALIILLAKYFSMRHVEMYRISHIIFSGVYVLIPSILSFFQPNLGSVLILVVIWVSTLVVSGIKIRHFMVLSGCGLLVLALSWVFLFKDYQKERIVSFVTPQAEIWGAGWSRAQAKIAIGAGGLFGQGIGRGSQTQYGFLPEPQTDFIFSAIAEETGLLGISLLLFLYSVLLWRIMKIALEAKNNFPRLFAFGFAIILASHIFINIGMNLGILPIIGIPLPLISYGGSFLIVIFSGFGILQSMKTN